MKKIFWTLAVMMAAGVAYAAGSSVLKLSQIGPSYATSLVTIAGVSGARNCISDLDVTDDSSAQVVVLTGGTTSYSVDLSSGSGVVRSWADDRAICGAVAQAVYIDVHAGNFRINYGGFTK